MPLCYVAGGSAPPGVVPMLKTAGNDYMVLNGAQPMLFASQTMNDNHLYWVGLPTLHQQRIATRRYFFALQEGEGIPGQGHQRGISWSLSHPKE